MPEELLHFLHRVSGGFPEDGAGLAVEAVHVAIPGSETDPPLIIQQAEESMIPLVLNFHRTEPSGANL